MYERTGKGGEGGREERERHTHRQTEREARGARATGRARGDGGVSLLPAPPTSLMVPEDASCQPLFSAVVAAEQRVRRGETASRTSTRLSTLVIACTTDLFVKFVLSASLLCDGAKANLCHPKRAGRDPKKSSAKTAVAVHAYSTVHVRAVSHFCAPDRAGVTSQLIPILSFAR